MDENLTSTNLNIEDLITIDNTELGDSISSIDYTGSFGFGNTYPSITSSNQGVFHTFNSNADMVISGDLKVKGVSILESLEKIEKRLAILRPDPEKLEKFEALRKAYEQYKTLEALCQIEEKE